MTPPTELAEACVDLLVLSAYSSELVGMRRLLGDDLDGDVGGLRVICKSVGVGLPNATAGTVARVLQRKARAAILIGTSGAFPTCELAIGDTVVPRRVHLIDGGELEGRLDLPEPMSRALDCNPFLGLGLTKGVPTHVDVATTLGYTVDDFLVARLGELLGPSVENIEAFGVANACALHKVPFACVLGVAYRAGGGGRGDWRAHHKSAALAACEVVNRWLSSGAMGLPHRPVAAPLPIPTP